MRVRLLLVLLAVCSFAVSAAASGTVPPPADSAVVFRFRPGDPLFLGNGYAHNGQSIDSLSARILRNRTAIDRDLQKIRVYGFCSPVGTPAEDILTAKTRSNQVKSYFITRYGLRESDFRTRNRLRPHQNLRDAVLVVYPGGGRAAPKSGCAPSDTTAAKETPEPEETPAPEPEISYCQPTETSSVPRSTPCVIPAKQSRPEHPRNIIALKTNVLFLAATVANLGVEFGFGRRFSIDIPVTYSPYVVSRDFRLQTLTVQPEFRCWLSEPMRGHFFGLHGHVGSFNIAVNNHTRYQDRGGNSPLWGVGLSYGYALRLSHCWGLEFTLGAGYANIRYDSFYNLPNGAQITSATKNYWGLTRAGISVVYRIGQWGTQR